MCSPEGTWTDTSFKKELQSDPHFPDFPILERVNVTEDGGVVKDILKYGEGEEYPPKKSEVTVHYTGKLASDGSQFDSSRDRDQKFEFTLGEGKVIKSWDLGVASMKRGERAILTCTSDYGYGAGGSGAKIPGGASLKFDVELFDWEEYSGDTVTGDKMVTKKQLQEGSGWRKPNDYATVTVRYSGAVKDGPVFCEEQERTLVIGEDDDVPSGFMTACKNMQKGEKSEFTIKPSVHHFADDQVPNGITTQDTIVYTIEMVDFTRAKETYEMDTKDKVEFALKCKARGNDLFKKGRLYDAEKRYELMISTLEKLDDDASTDDQKASKQTIITAYTNLAACQLKQEKYAETEQNCTKALKQDPENAKALFRRAKARKAMHDIEGAYADARSGSKLKPDDKALKHLQKQLKSQVNKLRSKQEKMFGRVFTQRLYKDAKPGVDPKKEKEKRKGNYKNGRRGGRGGRRGGRGGYGGRGGKRESTENAGNTESSKNETDKPVPMETDDIGIDSTVIQGPNFTPDTTEALMAEAATLEAAMKGSDNEPIKDTQNDNPVEKTSEVESEKPSTEASS